MMKSLKAALEKKLPALVLAILAIQPMLDVLSYFLMEMGSNAFSTAVRFVMLAAVALLGFILSDQKKLYFIFYGIAALFWVLHMANCFRVGYRSPVADTANFLRLLNFPIFTLSFITFFQKGKNIRKMIYTGIAIDFGEVLLFTALPWLLGHPVYTYRILKVGIMGWFAIPSAQNAVIVLAIPLTIFWAYRTKKYPVFLAAVLLCFGLMFVTGTKLTFYSIFIIAGAYSFLFILNLKKKSLKYVLPLLAVAVLAYGFRYYSPMADRERQYAYALGNYESLVEASMKNNGGDAEALQALRDGFDTANTSEELLEKIRRTLFGVYTDKQVYGALLKDLYARFGVYNVMEAYDYTYQPPILSDTRVRKNIFARLMWEEKDLGTRLLGFEYSDMLMGEETYDLENDFPAVYYFCGYLGFSLYLLIFIYLFFIIFRAFFKDISACAREREEKQGNKFVKGLGSFWQGMKRFLTVEMGAVGMTFLLAVIAAQVSGNVLRRPNVTVYFAVTAAYMYHLTVDLRKRENR